VDDLDKGKNPDVKGRQIRELVKDIPIRCGSPLFLGSLVQLQLTGLRSWSSTQRMIHRALLFKDTIKRCCDRVCRKDLQPYSISDGEWAALVKINDYLLIFRETTVAMSIGKQSSLSSTFAMFHYLFAQLEGQLRSIKTDFRDAQSMIEGLIKSHQKLAKYHGNIDKSPFYMWSVCKYHLWLLLRCLILLFAVLDPRYKKQFFTHDPFFAESEWKAALCTSITSLIEIIQVRYGSISVC
jgi:hypothetical protein